MKRKIILTADGSHSLEVEELDETYHSRHGARQESMHVFIKEGLLPLLEVQQHISILEIGFGTGLNALLSWENIADSQVKIEYHGLEAFPVTTKEAALLNYAETEDSIACFQKMHAVEWNEKVEITENFLLHKRHETLQSSKLAAGFFNLVYFDAFGPRAQPEMWKPENFEKIYQSMRSGGVLVTYCAKGQVRRDMISVGFEVERIPGPPGKRQMMRARK